MHTEVFAASTGLDITGVLALQPLHEAAGQLPTQERVFPIGLLSEAQVGSLLGALSPHPHSLANHGHVQLVSHGPVWPNPSQGTPSQAGTWFLPHSGCLMMFRTGLKQLSPVWSL